MNKKTIYIIVIFLLILICSVVTYLAITKNTEKNPDDLVTITGDNLSDFNDYVFKLDTNNKYEIITDMQWKTMRDDGGSHTSIYYQVDLENNIISKIQETYEANLGGIPKTEKNWIYIKEIDTNTQQAAKSLFNEIITKEDINETHNYNFFTILSLNSEKDIFNLDTIESINNFLQKIDKLQ